MGHCRFCAASCAARSLPGACSGVWGAEHSEEFCRPPSTAGFCQISLLSTLDARLCCIKSGKAALFCCPKPAALCQTRSASSLSFSGFDCTYNTPFLASPKHLPDSEGLMRDQAWTYKKLGFPIPYLVVGRWGMTPFPSKTALKFIVGLPIAPPDIPLGGEVSRPAPLLRLFC